MGVVTARTQEPTPPTVEELARWLDVARQQLATVVHLQQRHIDKHLMTWALPANASGDLSSVAGHLLDAATRDANTQGVAEVHYAILAWVDPSDARPVNTFPFALKGSGPTRSHGVGDIESSTLAGVLGMSMRHSEGMHRMVLTSTEERDQGYRDQIRDLNAQIRDLNGKLDRANRRNELEASKRLEIVALAEELTRDKLSRELAQKRFRLEEERQQFLSRQLEGMFPIILNRLTGGGKGKGAPMMGQTMVMKLLASLKPEQVDALTTGLALEPEQIALFGELYMAYGDLAKREQARKQHANRSHANGAAGAAEPESTTTEETAP